MRKYYLCNKGRLEFCSGLVWMFLSGMFCRFYEDDDGLSDERKGENCFEGNAKIT